MISTNGIQNLTTPVERQIRPTLAENDHVRGKSAESVGHRAKAFVAESGDAAANAIGKAAAMIAKTQLDAAGGAQTDPQPISSD